MCIHQSYCIKVIPSPYNQKTLYGHPVILDHCMLEKKFTSYAAGWDLAATKQPDSYMILIELLFSQNLYRECLSLIQQCYPFGQHLILSASRFCPIEKYNTKFRSFLGGQLSWNCSTLSMLSHIIVIKILANSIKRCLIIKNTCLIHLRNFTLMA